MRLDEAITTAIAYEKRVHGAYAEAAAAAKEPAAKRAFEVLAKEEEGHVAYLESRLGEWTRRGHLEEVDLQSVVPSVERIAAGMAKIRARMAAPGKAPGATTPELASLHRALELENETLAFYRRMVDETDAEGRRLFARFLEIEQAHGAIVQAQIDAVTGLGFWFDIQEFSLEGA